MAEEPTKAKTEDAAGNDKPEESKKAGAGVLFGGEHDLMDLFEEDDEINEELAALTAGLEDVAIGDLLAQVKDIRAILDRR